MFCTHCGKETPEGSRFCAQCGQEIMGVANTATKNNYHVYGTGNKKNVTQQPMTGTETKSSVYVRGHGTQASSSPSYISKRPVNREPDAFERFIGVCLGQK